MDRRRFSHLLASGFLVPWTRVIAGDSNSNLELSRLVPDVEAARIVGRSYLQSHRHLNERTLKLDLGLGTSSSADGLEWMLRRRIRDDFYASRTVIVEGWLLARGEAALCALVALGISHVSRL